MFLCSSCDKSYRTQRGLNQHRAKSMSCKTSQSVADEHLSKVNEQKIVNTEPVEQILPVVEENEKVLYTWGKYRDVEFEENVCFAYEQIVYWKRNLFMLPTGKAGRLFIDEITKLIRAWVEESPLKRISMKAIMIMPSLLLQKPSKTSKSKDHLKALERRMESWQAGDLLDLLQEIITIQRSLKSSTNNKNISKISEKFAIEMQKGNINGALKLLTNNMQNGILPLNDKTIAALRMKHPDALPADPAIILPDEIPAVHPIRYESINTEEIRKAALKTKGGSGPSGMDAEGWRRILTSKSFGDSSSDLCKAIAYFTRKLCSERAPSESIEALLACRLIPLDKNPGIRPIGVGEILRRIIGKTVVAATKSDIVSSVGSLQVCAGHDAGCEALVHAMRSIYEDEETEAVLLIDAANAFNSVNREAFLKNVNVICPSIATFVQNCYSSPSQMFVIGGVELSSKEGTTQGDPIAMAIYAIAVIPLLLMVLEITESRASERTRAAAFADDFTASGTIAGIKYWWDQLCKIGPKFGYFPEATKSWLIVKPCLKSKAIKSFVNSGVNITTDGKRHLGAALGTNDYKNEYLSDIVDEWIEEIKVLSEIAKSKPQPAYSCFISGFRHKVTYFMRTIPGAESQLKRLDEIILTHFIPAITDGIICNEEERKLLSLPPKFGGLSIPLFSKVAQHEFENSFKLTKNLRTKIVQQSRQYEIGDEEQTIKKEIHHERLTKHKELLQSLRKNMAPDSLRRNDLNIEPGASLWLSSLPLKDEGYCLNKQTFWDLIRLRYGWQLKRTPENCECGARFNLQHALSCVKGGFISIRHNRIRDITANLLKEVCRDVRIEPHLQPLTGEAFKENTANLSDEARCDVSARGFWVAGQVAFFDMRIFNPTATRYSNQSLAKSYEVNEKEKKKAYGERIFQIEHGSFTPIVMSATGGMARESKKFFSRLAAMIADKRKQSISLISSWIRRKLAFALIHSISMDLRGSRSVSSLVVSICDDAKSSEKRSKIGDD